MGSLISSPKSDPEVVMASPAADFVRSQIESNKILIFSKSYCPFCTMAKEQFKKLNIEAYSIEIENRSDCGEIQDVLNEMTGARSVPRVFVNGQFIGGGTDVRTLYESGKLKAMLGL